LQFRAEILHRLVESRFVEIELRPAADQREAQALKSVGHQLRVVGRVSSAGTNS
jgi:hypothetical protein